MGAIDIGASPIVGVGVARGRRRGWGRRDGYTRGGVVAEGAVTRQGDGGRWGGQRMGSRQRANLWMGRRRNRNISLSHQVVPPLPPPALPPGFPFIPTQSIDMGAIDIGASPIVGIGAAGGRRRG
ncbi:hypothetical protein E2562_029193 [Oryza meyeriana var. granulata]|uniref:Uncharacterized protein n=1 Tax=Oryza meyeriana var. granulata TaxID=110450 RepID=A0A6G1E5W5_9ORYZ|nr:hypothetical protein E2562_029193 [Oryza meyeriana var. granulata]